MAVSPAHKWGQIIGDFVESIIEEELYLFSLKHDLFLDKQGIRLARKGKKVSWVDSFGNAHDLDFVLERAGTPEIIGVPVAFIEVAWRRYTKHSRNKAQEIQGAVLPLLTTHRNAAPFIGVVLAGEFTTGALNQLLSLGFNILHFPYELIVESFQFYHLEAGFEEHTSVEDFLKKIEKWKFFSEKEALKNYLLKQNESAVYQFFDSLEKVISRYIVSIIVTPLHGQFFSLTDIDTALTFIKEYHSTTQELYLLMIEITIVYNNGDKIHAIFKDKQSAIQFLETYRSPKPNI
jgi:hypothetical protein